MQVVVDKYERLINDFGGTEYIYKIGIVPGCRVIKTFYVPYDSPDIEEEDRKVVREIKSYLAENGLTAVNKY